MKKIILLLIIVFSIIFFNSEGYREYKTPQSVVVVEKQVKTEPERRFMSFNPMFAEEKLIYMLKVSNGCCYNVTKPFYDKTNIGDTVILRKGVLHKNNLKY